MRRRLARIGSAWFGKARRVKEWWAGAWLGSQGGFWNGLASQGSACSGSYVWVWMVGSAFGWVALGMEGQDWQGSARCDRARWGSDSPGLAGMVRTAKEWHGRARLGVAGKVGKG